MPYAKRRRADPMPRYKYPAGCEIKVSSFPTLTNPTPRLDTSFVLILIQDEQ